MKAICRVAKMKGAGSIGGKSDHNYRLGYVPNADPSRQHLNHEYVLNYETLSKAIQARIEQVGIQRVRQDAVKGMEFILTASPERFSRDENGQCNKDLRQSKWVAANLDFLKKQYGKNLVAFTLHQDEKTPHIHAIVVPITADNRLCAKELFTPKSLRQLQTDYAQAMEPFGLERGVRGSRALHQEMKQIYGIQQQERQIIENELKAAQPAEQPLQIEAPGVLDLLNLERWRREQEVKINAEYNRRLEEVKQTAQKAQNMAVANATAKEQEKVLRQRLETAEGLKQANYDKAQQTGQKLEQYRNTLARLAVMADEKRLNPQWGQQTAQQVREKNLPKLEKAITESLKGISSVENFGQRLNQKGYQVVTGQDQRTYLKDPKTEVRLDLLTHQIKGRLLGELIESSIEQTHKQQQERTQTPKQNRGWGLGH